MHHGGAVRLGPAAPGIRRLRCPSQMEKLFATAANAQQDMAERMSALNTAARLGP